jgi:hypothetical protein
VVYKNTTSEREEKEWLLFFFTFEGFRGSLIEDSVWAKGPKTMCVVVCLSVRFLVGIFRGPVTPPTRSGVAAAVFLAFQRWLGLTLSSSSKLWLLPLNTLLFLPLKGRTRATLPALLDSGRHFVNGFLVCIDPAFALVHESEPFETFISSPHRKVLVSVVWAGRTAVG